MSLSNNIIMKKRSDISKAVPLLLNYDAIDGCGERMMFQPWTTFQELHENQSIEDKKKQQENRLELFPLGIFPPKWLSQGLQMLPLCHRNVLYSAVFVKLYKFFFNKWRDIGESLSKTFVKRKHLSCLNWTGVGSPVGPKNKNVFFLLLSTVTVKGGIEISQLWQI